MITKYNFILLLCLLMSNVASKAQTKTWSLLIEKEVSFLGGNFVGETDSFYIIIGNAFETLPTNQQGFSISKLRKSDGKLVNTAYYGEENTELFFNYVKNIIIDNEVAIFPMMSIRGALFLYKVELSTLKVEKIATISTLDYKGFFLFDFTSTDQYYYLSGALRTDTLSYPHILKIDKLTLETTYLKLNDEPNITNSSCLIPYNDGILVAVDQQGPELLTAGIKFMYFSQDNELIWQYISPTIVPNWGCTNLLQINPKEFLFVSTDPQWNYPEFQAENRVSVMRFNTETKKSAWYTWWNEPRKPQVFHRNEVIKGLRPNEYLLMANDGVIQDTFNYGTGKIVKFNGEGKRIWQKTYYDSNKWAVNNTFEDIMITSDSCYLIVGSQYLARTAWLVKIDEDGNILPIDTVSTAIDWSIPNKATEISIYPNPAASSIIINQGEIADVRYIITDMNGQSIQEITVASQHQNTLWDISDLPCGTYVITMMHDQKVIGQIRQVVVK